MDNERKKLIPNKLEETESILYDRDTEPNIVTPHKLQRDELSVPTVWNTQSTMKKKTTKKHLMHSRSFRNVFMIGLIFFVGAFIFSMLTIFRGGATVSNNNIDIVVLGNSFVDGGEELLLELKVANRNRTPIEIADMLVEYSRGVGGVNDMVRERISLGEIGSGDVVSEIVPVTLFGEQGSIRTLSFTLEYRISNSNAIFLKEYTYEVTIANSPVDVVVTGPSEVVSNQNFTTDITINQNSTEISERMMVIANYPSGFKFESATPAPDFGNNKWFLGDLAPGSEREISITGSIRASSGEERIITIVTGTQDDSDEQSIGVQFTATPHSVTIGAPFLSFDMSHENDTDGEFSISAQGENQFVVNYTNPLTDTIRDVEITLRFSGSAFDPNRVTVNQGFFDISKNAIVWSHTNNNALDAISPGTSGQLYFFIQPKANVANGSISFAIDASGIPVGAGRDTVTNIYTGTARVGSTVSLGGTVLYQSGPFVNTGPLPPRVGQETTYTVEWQIDPVQSTMEDIVVTTELPSYVNWKGNSHPLDENIEYNPNNRRVRWRPRDMEPGQGAQTVSFQIGLIPSLTQVGIAPVLVGQSSFSGYDRFSEETIEASLGALNSVLSSDAGYNQINDKVVLE